MMLPSPFWSRMAERPPREPPGPPGPPELPEGVEAWDWEAEFPALERAPRTTGMSMGRTLAVSSGERPMRPAMTCSA